MRSDPEAFAGALAAACRAWPEQRSTQVLFNALGEDPFYLEDRIAIEMLYAYAKRG